MGLGLLASIRIHLDPSSERLVFLRAGRMLATLALVWATAVAIELVKADLPPLIDILVWVVGVVGVWLAMAHGMVALALRRRKRRSWDYGEVSAARDVKAELELSLWFKVLERRKLKAKAKRS